MSLLRDWRNMYYKLLYKFKTNANTTLAHLFQAFIASLFALFSTLPLFPPFNSYLNSPYHITFKNPSPILHIVEARIIC